MTLDSRSIQYSDLYLQCRDVMYYPSQPSRVIAFTSLVSAGGVPTIAANGLIALLRFAMTPNNFKSSYFFLGRFRKAYYFVTVLFNGLIVAVCFPASVHTGS